MDDPRTAGFVARLDAVNDVADATPGFVWRTADDDLADPARVPVGPLML